jgi:hypothetical protein
MKLASEFLDGQMSVVGKLKNVLNIHMPLGFTVAQGEPQINQLIALASIE